MANCRIAILGSRGIPARYGGFETFAQEIAVRLARSDVDVTVFCENDGPSSYEGVRLAYAPAAPLGPLTTIAFDLRCLWIARKTYDVVYMLGYGAALFCFIPRLWSTTVWINMDGIEWSRSKWAAPARLWLKGMEWFATKTASRLIVDAAAIGEHLRRRHTRLPPVSMIPYGVAGPRQPPDESMLHSFDLKPQSYNLIVCRLEPENHVLEIVKGYETLNSVEPLVVVGGLSAESNYVRLLLAHQSDQIRFIGSIYDANLLWALRFYCGIYFHGHSVGGTNPSLLEAMVSGNLIIAHDNQFNREVLGSYGYFFNDAEDIAQLMSNLTNLDKATIASHKAGVRNRAIQRYSWDDVLDSYVALINDVLAPT